MQKKIKEPNFFIVGAAKSGTSSLTDYLKQHPDIYMSPVKEPFYFVSGIGLDDYDEYLSLFKKAGDAISIGEATTGYLFDEFSATAIHKQFPYAKIFIILRNPVNMAFSHWKYILAAGSESMSFEEAISNKEREYRKNEQFKKSCSGWYANYLYLEKALYFNQVKRYLDVFGRDSAKVYIFESFIKSPETICKDIFKFLKVNSEFTPDCRRVVNEGGEVRFQFLRRIRNREYPLLRSLLPFIFRRKVRVLTRGINIKRGRKILMDPTTRKTLEEFFCDDIAKLESLLEQDIPEWKSK